MTVSVITALIADTEEMTLDVIPYLLELKGKPEPRVKVRKLQNLDMGGYTVSVESPLVDGKPLLSLSTMDAIARRILPTARVYAGNKGGLVKRRMYSAS